MVESKLEDYIVYIDSLKTDMVPYSIAAALLDKQSKVLYEQAKVMLEQSEKLLEHAISNFDKITSEIK